MCRKSTSRPFTYTPARFLQTLLEPSRSNACGPLSSGLGSTTFQLCLVNSSRLFSNLRVLRGGVEVLRPTNPYRRPFPQKQKSSAPLRVSPA
jgi:hypothetical protein